jgi:hypothetical protein
MDKSTNERISVRLPKDTADSVSKYAAKNHITISEAIRRFIDKGLSIESYTEEQTAIQNYIREAVDIALDKPIDRLIRLQLKATKSSTTAMYATVSMLSDHFIDDATYAEVLAEALHQSAIYMKQKEEPFEAYLSEARKLIEGARKIGTIKDM